MYVCIACSHMTLDLKSKYVFMIGTCYVCLMSCKKNCTKGLCYEKATPFTLVGLPMFLLLLL